MPGGEIYEAMKRGVIDAFEYSTPAVNFDMGFHEIAKYAVFPGIHAPGVLMPFLVNKAAWEKLPDDLKLLLKEEVLAECIKNYAIESVGDMEGVEKLKAYGTSIIYLSEDVQKEIAEASVDFYNSKAATDPFFAKVWNSVSQFTKAMRETNSLQYAK